MGYELTKRQKIYLPIKRFFDIILCLPACVILAPIMLMCMLAIKLDSPGPVFFKQKRVGKDKEYFYIWKFRTMRTDAPKDVATHLLQNPESYITKTGKFMRAHSLDELPQLYQCLFTGELYLVAPRPALWNQDDLVKERDKYGVHCIKPGITGWAQINGRDELEIKDKARLDGEYIQRMSFLFDCRCLFGTVFSVLRADGVVEGGTGQNKTVK